ncbi:MAG: hypothetical protein IPM97_01195 [Bdellovibrionaceae bacterium]|nr:hypothetical protein [Pseudobdellovibrionaceae bacterium]
MTSIQCKVDIPKVQGLEEGLLTVGREFFLICDGEWPKDLVQDKVFLESEGAQKYQLTLLGFEFRSLTEADLKVTSYLPGRHKFPNLILSDGVKKIELGPVEFQVQSVLTPGEKVEPYGPFGPALIPIPFFYWIVLVFIFGLMSLVIGLRIWRHNQRKAMLEKLKQHESSMTPLQEFHQSMRKLQRGNKVFYGGSSTAEEIHLGMTELARMFKVYVCRRLRVPAFDWSESLILADIRRFHPDLFKDYSRKLHDLFSEFKKAESTSIKLHEKDVTQLAESVRKVVEGIENSMVQTEAAKRGGRR